MQTSEKAIKPKELLGLEFNNGVGSIPISLNHNDKNSQFAGSIFSGAILTAYFNIRSWFESEEIAGDLVAKNTNIRFLAPIYSDASTKLVHRSEAVQKANGNYELECEVHITDENEHKCAVLEVSFVFIPAQKK